MPHQNEKWVPLADAAQRMYDELEGTDWRMTADKEPTTEARLNYMAMALAHHAPIEGRPPPSSSYKHIAPKEFDAGLIKGSGKYFQRHYESYLTFVDMRVREEDLLDALERMKAGKHKT